MYIRYEAGREFLKLTVEQDPELSVEHNLFPDRLLRQGSQREPELIQYAAVAAAPDTAAGQASRDECGLRLGAQH